MSWADRVRAWLADPMLFISEVLSHPDGRSYGAHLDDWQAEDMRVMLTDTRHVWLERPRGHSKSSDLGAVMLYFLVCGPPGGRYYLAACDQAQAALIYDAVRGFVTRSPILREVVTLYRHEAIVEATDSTLTVLPADSPGAWGLRPDAIGVDEFEAWRGEQAEEFWHALISALGKKPHARAFVSLTAGWSKDCLAWRVREQVMNDPAWAFLRRGQCASWIRPDFLEQQRRILPEPMFKALHLNEWTESGSSALTYDEVVAVFDPGLRERTTGRGRFYAGLDIGTASDRTALVVLHQEPDGVAVIDTIAVWTGSPERRVPLPEVEETVVELARRFGRLTVSLDPYQGVLLAQRLRARGVDVEEYPFTPASRARLYGVLLQAIRARKLRCYDHDGLRRELLGLRWVERAGMLQPDHSSTGHDDITVATGLALVQATGEELRPAEDPEALEAMRRMRVYTGSASYGGDWAAESDAALFAAYRGRRVYLDESDPSELVPKPKIGPGGIVTM